MWRRRLAILIPDHHLHRIVRIAQRHNLINIILTKEKMKTSFFFHIPRYMEIETRIGNIRVWLKINRGHQNPSFLSFPLFLSIHSMSFLIPIFFLFPLFDFTWNRTQDSSCVFIKKKCCIRRCKQYALNQDAIIAVYRERERKVSKEREREVP